jgi:hypothetical protein
MIAVVVATQTLVVAGLMLAARMSYGPEEAAAVPVRETLVLGMTVAALIAVSS